MGVLAPTVHWLSEILLTVLWFLSAEGSDRAKDSERRGKQMIVEGEVG